MTPTGAARVAIARLTARRFGRDAPPEELRRELRHLGLDDARSDAALQELETRRLAVRTPSGWRLTSPPLPMRAPAAIASFAWLH